jgi:hypothetical protein
MDTDPLGPQQASQAPGLPRSDKLLPVITWGPDAWPFIQVGGSGVMRRLLRKDAIEGLGVENEEYVCPDPLALPSVDTRRNPYAPGLWRIFVSRCSKDYDSPAERRLSLMPLYRAHGPVTGFGASNGYESLEAVRVAGLWLQALTRLESLLSRRDIRGLWELCAEVESRSIEGKYFSACIPGSDGPERLEIPFAPETRGPSVAWLDATPEQNAAMFKEARHAVSTAAASRLARIKTPIEYRSRFYWGFEVGGVLDAAFLDWFFEWRSIKDNRRCEACGEPVPPGRRKWCTDRCRERMYKREQRRNKDYGPRLGPSVRGLESD